MFVFFFYYFFQTEGQVEGENDRGEHDEVVGALRSAVDVSVCLRAGTTQALMEAELERKRPGPQY